MACVGTDYIPEKFLIMVTNGVEVMGSTDWLIGGGQGRE